LYVQYYLFKREENFSFTIDDYLWLQYSIRLISFGEMAGQFSKSDWLSRNKLRRAMWAFPVKVPSLDTW